MKKTIIQYEALLQKCKDIFFKKNKDYGTSWRILRLPSLTDQIFIKASRIRSLEENRVHKIDEGVNSEYIGLVNYCLIALIQFELPEDTALELPKEALELLYDKYVTITKELMINKNHDYNEVWREMRISSLTDLILMKIRRIKQIEDNKGKTIASEGVDANYMDIINYSLFALIKLEEN